MTCYQAMVSDLCEKMIGEQLPYKDTILLGDNSSGKSDVLKGVITNGTGKGLDLGDMPCAGKTGTTNPTRCSRHSASRRSMRISSTSGCASSASTGNAKSGCNRVSR